MNHEQAPNRERTYPPLLVAIVLALLLLLAVASLGSYRDLQAAQQRQELLEAKIEATLQRNEELTRRIQRLQDDPLAIERLAREHYGMMHPGDVVIVLPQEAAPTSAAIPVAEPSATTPPGTG